MIRGTRILAVVALCLLVGAASLLAQSAPQAPVKVNPPAALKSKAGHPPANAGKGTSIGKGMASTTTANAPGDTDSVWAEKIDVDGDGKVDDTQFLWDDEDKVLYFSKNGTFTCANGGTGSGGILVAVYGEGNPYAKRPIPAGGSPRSTRANAACSRPVSWDASSTAPVRTRPAAWR